MKIVILGPAHPLRGGIAAFNERMAMALAEKGHDVEIFSFSLQYPSFLFPGKTQYSDEPAPKGFTIHTVINSVNPFNWFRWGNHIRKLRPDMLIFKYWIPFMAPSVGTILRMVRKNRHTRIIMIPDNLIPHERLPLSDLLTRYVARQADGFLAMSREVFNQVPSFNSKGINRFSPHPVYDHYGKPVDKSEARQFLNLPAWGKCLLFFGFIRDYKGLDLLLRAMPAVKEHLPDVFLVVAGELYTSSEPYLSLVKDLDLSKMVFLHTDFIPDSKVALYFSAADLVVQPYKHATQSGVTQIAYHFGVPMVVTNVGGLAEFIPDGKVGYVVEPEPDSIAKGIIRFFSTLAEVDYQGGIQEVRKQYSWEYFVDTLERLYSDIVTNQANYP